MGYNKINRCVCCDSDAVSPLLDLGQQPLANNLKTHSEKYPLLVNLCEQCWHMQLSVAVDPSELFSEYLYVSGTTKTLRDYFEWFSNFAIEQRPGATTILDIACNDGSQLDAFADIGLQTYGVDPAKNLWPISTQRHSVVCDFFNEASCSQLNTPVFDLIVAQNVVAHTADPCALLSDCKKFMSADSLLMIQTSQANMVVNGEFDTVYHEHISFFSLSSMCALANRAGLYVVDAIKTPIHGTSWVFILSTVQNNAARMQNLLDLEAAQGLHNIYTYMSYIDNCRSIQDGLKSMMQLLRNNGAKLIGYGAAAKGMTLLNSIDESLDCIIDDNTLKQGTLAPGNLTPIVSNSILSQLDHDTKVVFVPLAWNFFTEIRARIQQQRQNNNDQFLRYFPRVELIQ